MLGAGEGIRQYLSIVEDPARKKGRSAGGQDFPSEGWRRNELADFCLVPAFPVSGERPWAVVREGWQERKSAGPLARFPASRSITTKAPGKAPGIGTMAF